MFTIPTGGRNLPRYLRHMLRPARDGAAGVVGGFTLGLYLAAKAGLAGLPLAILLASWFFKYAYILFDHVVNGYDEPPVLDMQMMNPVDEQRPVAQIAILGLIVVGVKLVDAGFGARVATGLALFLAAWLPASIAVLGLEGNAAKAVYPVLLVRMIKGLGPAYLLVLALVAAYALCLTLVVRLEFWLPVATAMAMFATLSVYSVLGGAIYERRDALGIEPFQSPERTAARARELELRQDQRAVDAAYDQTRIGAHANAWRLLQDWLDSRGGAIEDYRWLCDRVANWPDARYPTRLTQEYVARLLALKRTGEALDVVTARLRLDPGFRPAAAAATLQLARMAAVGGAPRTARTLLADFAQHYPGDPNVPSALSLARERGLMH